MLLMSLEQAQTGRKREIEEDAEGHKITIKGMEIQAGK